MFFKRKKPAESPAPAPAKVPAAPPPERELGPPTTQFLTGDQGADRRTVQVLLEAIARVSEFRDIDQLLIDIVDRSIEITGAERGLLLLDNGGGPDAGLEVRVARQRGAKELAGGLRFSTSIAGRVLSERAPPITGGHVTPQGC